MATPSDHETLRALVSFQGAYHNHKEQLGYAAAALYVSGALVLLFGPASWRAYPPWGKALFLLLLSVTGVAGIFYVFWQFHLRFVAADQIERYLDDLDRARHRIEPRAGWFERWAAPGTALLVMLLWAAGAFVRVVCTLD